MTSEISSAIRSSAQRNSQIFVPVGYAGSGKTELRDHIQRKTGAQVVYVGNLTIKEIEARGFEKPTPELEKQVREELREKGGPDIYARRAIPLIKEQIEKGENVIVDGIYSLVEWQVLIEELPGVALHLIAVMASPEVRHARLASRPDRPFNREQAEQRDKDEDRIMHKQQLIDSAEYKIENEGTVEEFYQKIDFVLSQIQEEGKQDDSN